MLTLTHIAGFASGGAAPDIVAPTITSSNTASVQEDATLAHALTANESVTWSLVGGADQARFELSGSTLRWLSNGVKDFEAPDDADTNNTYVVTVRATDNALNTADQTITVTVTDVAEPPLDGLSAITGAWSLDRNLLTSFGAGTKYDQTSGRVTTLYDQSGNSRNFAAHATEARRPLVTTAGPNSRTCMDVHETVGSECLLTAAAISNFIAAGAGFMIVTVMFDALTLNNANIETNHRVLGDGGGFMGLYAKSVPSVSAYNWDGSRDVVAQTVGTSAPHVITWRHEGGNLFVSVDGAAETSAASGNTTTLTNILAIGATTGQVLDAKWFEAAIFSTPPSGAEITTLIANFKTQVGI